MIKRRQERISAEIKKVLSVALFNMKDPAISAMTTITEVHVTNDLSFCDVLFSVMGDERQKEEVMNALKGASGYFKGYIAREMDLRQVPELRIKLDDRLEYQDRINSILNELNIDHEDGDLNE
ncbi:MAG: 30S ribosome-binding factor RbfA [Ezakiella sp.]|nr:30S ribosome-binding factor RbfA [Ezakiella sp.]MDD7761895.1 30S ribosome-binding factor RbfA [Bacillota bacterium]MDY3946710.1 30S ribosome-binding factor RbfA [Ezakiella sp.]